MSACVSASVCVRESACDLERQRMCMSVCVCGRQEGGGG